MANINKTSGKALRAQGCRCRFCRGLTAAIALRQNGWDVTLHEKDSELRAFGAGIYSGGTMACACLKASTRSMTCFTAPTLPPAYETWMHNKSVSKETFNGLPWRVNDPCARSTTRWSKRAHEVGINVRNEI